MQCNFLYAPTLYLYIYFIVFRITQFSTTLIIKINLNHSMQEKYNIYGHPNSIFNFISFKEIYL